MLFFAERENGNDFMQEGKRKMKQTMDKERWKGWLISFFMETLGGFLVAVSLDSFAVNAGFPLTVGNAHRCDYHFTEYSACLFVL